MGVQAERGGSLRARHRVAAIALLLGALIGCTGGGGSGGGAAARGQAIVLITVDGLQAEQLELPDGGTSAPAIARLLASGTLWSDAWTACPMTRPAVATYLTGVAPDRHGVRDDIFTPLPASIPTLATRLTERGYRTAAFPNSSMLGFGSGLLDGFEIVDEPPPIPVSPGRWYPAVNDPARTAEDAAGWLRELPPGASYFAWVHVSQLLLDQLKLDRKRDRRNAGLLPERRQVEDEPEAGNEAPAEEPEAGDDVSPLSPLDLTVAAVLDALDARGDLERSTVVLAGTSGYLRGDDDLENLSDKREAQGAGFSLGERAIRVPVIARFPAGQGSPRPSELPVWAPDVPATLAALAGVELASAAEGISLFESPGEDRPLFSWSWAMLDQLGWRALRAARASGFKLSEGFEEATTALDGSGREIDEATASRLREAVASRKTPPAPRVPLDEVRDLLEGSGIELDPVPAEGRAFGTAPQRVMISARVWGARWLFRENRPGGALRRYGVAGTIDEDNLGVLLDLGQAYAMSQEFDPALEILGHAVARYPTRPEVLHWYAHALWSSEPDRVERILEAIRPYKPQDADLLYDLACVRSVAGDLEASERFLRQAIGAGFRAWEHMDSDPDLRNLRESGRYAAVIREVGS